MCESVRTKGFDAPRKDECIERAIREDLGGPICEAHYR